MEFYDLRLDSSEFCILYAILLEEFVRSRRAFICNRLGKYEKDYFLNSLVPFFEKIESIRLGRKVKYDLKNW